MRCRLLPRARWTDRRFDFTLQPALFPAILERLRGSPDRLAERTRPLPVDLLTRREGAQWSIQEHAGHLGDLEPLWGRRVDQLFAGDAELIPADMTNRATEEAAHNTRLLDDVLATFTAARQALVNRLGGADEADVVRTALHPRLRQPMRLIDLAFFVAEHDDHHLATITSLRLQGGVE